MLSFLAFISTLFAFAHSYGQLTVLQHTDSIEFKGNDYLKESLLPEVFSAALGFTIEQDSNWQGMYLKDPFNLAKSVVTVVIDGVPSLNINKGHYFPLHTDEDEKEIFDSLKNRIEDHSPRNNHLVRVDLSNDEERNIIYELFKSTKNHDKIEYKYLKIEAEEDRKFIEELQILNSFATGLESNEDIPKVIWFKVTSLHALSDVYGPNSTVLNEAKQLLSETLHRINSALKKDNVLFAVITSDASHTRRVRSTSNKSGREADDLNVAISYSEDYPVIFNIILWFGVVFVFSLLAISVFIASMDPGRDSIIYRMTSTRMKKDN